MTVRILQGDVRDMLATLPDESVQVVCTSPPYYSLRDYGTATWEGGDAICDHAERELRRGVNLAQSAASTRGGAKKIAEAGWLPYRDICGKCGAKRIDQQIGLEATPADFIATLMAVFDEVRRVLRKDGLCFVNLGDSYAGSGKGPSNSLQRPASCLNDRQLAAAAVPTAWIPVPDGVKPKDLLLIPERFAIAMQDRGWWVRSRICWAKTSAMPESVRDRPTSAWEHIWMFSKSRTYYYDAEAVRQPLSPNGGHEHVRAQNGGGSALSMAGHDYSRGGLGSMKSHPAGANLRNFWLLGPEPSTLEHYAGFVTEIPRRCILAGTSEKGACVECGAPWVRSNNLEKRYNSGHENTKVHQVSAESTDRSVRGRQAEDVGASLPMSGLRRGIETDSSDSKERRGARKSQAVSRGERREELRAEASVSAVAAGQGEDACEVTGLPSNRPGAGKRADCVEPIREDGDRQNQGSYTEQSPQSASAQCSRNLHGYGLAAHDDGSEESLSLLQEDLHHEEAGDDRPCDSAEQGRSAQLREYRRSMQAVQLGQVEPDRAPGLANWQPSCAHTDAETRPCVVLDPFLGSGTTAMVADRLGRDAIGIELNSDYVELARKRIDQDAGPMLSEPVTVEAPTQMPMSLEGVPG